MGVDWAFKKEIVLLLYGFHIFLLIKDQGLCNFSVCDQKDRLQISKNFSNFGIIFK